MGGWKGGWLTRLGGEVCRLEHGGPSRGCQLPLASAGAVGRQDADILCARVEPAKEELLLWEVSLPPRRHTSPDHVRLPPVLDGRDLRIVLQPTVRKLESVDGAILLIVRKQHIWLRAHDLLVCGRVRAIRQVVSDQEGALRVAVDPDQVGIIALVESVVVVVDRGRNPEVVGA